VPRVELMRAAQEEVVPNQAGNVCGKAGVAQLAPSEVSQRPNRSGEHYPLSLCFQRKWSFGLPCNGSEFGEMLDDFHEKSVSLLPGPVSSNQFRVNRILGGLGVLADGEGDGVRGTTSEVVADEINRERRNGTVPKFERSKVEGGCEEPRDGNIFADSLSHIAE
jgi:hypothetical protein